MSTLTATRRPRTIHPDPDDVPRAENSTRGVEACLFAVDEDLAALEGGGGFASRPEPIRRRQKLVEPRPCVLGIHRPFTIAHPPIMGQIGDR